MARAVPVIATLSCVAAGLAAIARATASTPARSACAHAAGRTLASDREARVFRRSDHQGGFDLLGCAFDDNRIVVLSQVDCVDQACTYFGNLRLAGRRTAYSLDETSSNSDHAVVEVRDLPSGRTLHRSTFEPAVDLGYTGGTTGLVLKRNGSVAWIRATCRPEAPPTSCQYVVLRLDSRGRSRLDAGPDVVPNSLTLKGSTLSWLDGGERRFASLC